jgi:hypothetical protein
MRLRLLKVMELNYFLRQSNVLWMFFEKGVSADEYQANHHKLDNEVIQARQAICNKVNGIQKRSDGLHSSPFKKSEARAKTITAFAAYVSSDKAGATFKGVNKVSKPINR